MPNTTAERWERWSKRNPEKANQRMRDWRHRNPKYMLRHSAERRSKAKGIDFALSLEDIPDIPSHCPIAGIALEPRNDGRRGPCDSSPTLDRIRGELGYIPGNVRIISHKANRWKGEMTRDQVQRVLDYIDGKL